MQTGSLREYSVFRGCTLRAVQKAIDAGRIGPAAYTKTKNGKKWKYVIDFEMANQHWEINTDPGQQRVATRADISSSRKKNISASQIIEDDIDDPFEDIPVGGISKGATRSPEEYQKNRAERERIECELKKIELEKEQNKIIEISVVGKRWQEVASHIKQNLLGIPSRTCANIAAAYKTVVDQVVGQIGAGEQVTVEQLRGIMAAILDDKKASDIMDAEIRETLQGLANGSFN
jgi:hypothetical protein